MILTYKIKHNKDISLDLHKAFQIAEFAIRTRALSTAQVKHFGLKSIIANQILRKYSRNKNCKRVKSVKLTIPNQGIRVNKLQREICIPSLKLTLPYHFSNNFEKINQIELDNQFAYASVSFNDAPERQVEGWIGVDLNTTKHCAVVSNQKTGKVLKLGKSAHHVHKKYKNIRRNMQRKGKYKLVKRISNRESRIVNDLNHKISRRIVEEALKNNTGIVLEDLKGIRKTSKQHKSFKYSLNSWSFYRLRKYIEYKAKLQGIPVVKIDPRYTSQQCSRCGLLGKRRENNFSCGCGHVEDSGANAGFVLALRHQGILQLPADRDVGKRSTDTRKRATVKTDSLPTLEPYDFSRRSMSGRS
jgi:putative transposase